MRIGTRGSALALAQAEPVARRLGGELVTIKTSGDAGRGPGDKARWVDAIEDALLAGDIDVAIHSAKDVPGDLAAGLSLVAAPPREDPRDVLVGAASLDDLPEGARVGTSSLRRRAQLLAVRPDLDVVELRGNVDTRLRKLDEGEAHALVLAAAGLVRLGRADRIGGFLDPEVFVPAPGQGTLALEARTPDPGSPVRTPDPGSPVRRVSDEAAWVALEAERAVCHALGASCHTPIGAWFDGTELHTFVGLPDGSQWVRDRAPADEALARLEAVGARDLLARAETAA